MDLGIKETEAPVSMRKRWLASRKVTSIHGHEVARGASTLDTSVGDEAIRFSGRLWKNCVGGVWGRESSFPCDGEKMGGSCGVFVCGLERCTNLSC